MSRGKGEPFPHLATVLTSGAYPGDVGYIPAGKTPNPQATEC